MTDHNAMNFYGDVSVMCDVLDAVLSQDYNEVYVDPLFKNDRVLMRGANRVVVSTSADGRAEEIYTTRSDMELSTMLRRSSPTR